MGEDNYVKWNSLEAVVFAHLLAAAFISTIDVARHTFSLRLKMNFFITGRMAKFLPGQSEIFNPLPSSFRIPASI